MSYKCPKCPICPINVLSVSNHKSQKKAKASHQSKEDSEAKPSLATQAYRKELPFSIEMFNEEYIKELINKEESNEVKQQDAHRQDVQEDIHFEKSCRKGVKPYEYIDSQDRFLEIKLPSIHEFSTYLSGKISQEDYLYAQKVWSEFECKNLDEYHNFYLKTDVLNLVEVWTVF
ncbi:12751_t:CDS:2 [Funneliformis geosporum]|nr:12751_t:CDS:2 [Funneliformis geosporum]